MLKPVSFACALAIAFMLNKPVHAGDIFSDSFIPHQPSFDIERATIKRQGVNLVFRMDVAQGAGSHVPKSVGRRDGAHIFAYIWPTTIDPSLVGFPRGSGMLALAVMAHPDFDDTPLVDEDGDGNNSNDGATWHTHWLVFDKTKECDASKLKIANLTKSQKNAVPKTWPKVPLLIDSPDLAPKFAGETVEVTVPGPISDSLGKASFDGITAAIRVDGTAARPKLCISLVFDTASGDLSLSGQID